MSTNRSSLKSFPYTGHLLVFSAAMFWSTSGVVFRGSTIPSMEFLLLRGLLTVGILGPFVFRQIKVSLIREDRWKFLLCGIAFIMYQWGFIQTTRGIGATTAITMQYSAPVYLYLVFLITERNLSIKRDYPKLIMVATLIVNTVWTSSRVTDIYLLIPAFMCGIGYALFIWAVRRISHHNPMMVVGSNNLISIFFYFPYIILLNEPLRTLTPFEILIVIGVSLFVNTLSYVMFSRGLKRIEPLTASFITLIEPVMNPILIMIILREVPEQLDLVILIIILGSLIIELLRSQNLAYKRRLVHGTHI